MKFCGECGASLVGESLTENDSSTNGPWKKIAWSTVVFVTLASAPLWIIGQRIDENIEQGTYEEETVEAELESIEELQQYSTDENGVDQIQLSENATPIKDMQANAGGGVQEEASQSVEDVYEEFRLNYNDALNMRDFSYVEQYFKDGTNIKESYRDFVEQVPTGDYYTFLTNTTETEHINDNVAIVTANEIFELETDNAAAEQKERTRKYTFERQVNTYVITQIENVEVIGAPSTVQSKKAEYLASVQYAIDLYGAASEHDNYKLGVYEAYDAMDYELNRIYGLLKEKLSAEDMENLRIEQRAWIKERDKDLDEKAQEIGVWGKAEFLFEFTMDRTFELIDMYFAY